LEPQDAGWSSLVARQAHNLKVAGSNPAPATKWFSSRKSFLIDPIGDAQAFRMISDGNEFITTF
jgi:hypothetical protein